MNRKTQRCQYELEVIQNNVTLNEANKVRSGDANFEQWLKRFTRPRVYRPFVVLIALFLFQQISGPYVIIFYAIDLFVKIGRSCGDQISEYGAMLLMGILRFILSIVCAL